VFIGVGFKIPVVTGPAVIVYSVVVKMEARFPWFKNEYLQLRYKGIDCFMEDELLFCYFNAVSFLTCRV
jgi:hypothetical protein